MIRNLFTKIQRYQTENGTEKFYDVLPDFVNAINSSVNRTIGMAPNDVRKENESIVWERMYEKYLKDLETPRPPPKYQAGNYVKISREKLLFEKV